MPARAFYRSHKLPNRRRSARMGPVVQSGDAGSMLSAEALRGYVLEEVLARLLNQSGYRLLVEASQDIDALRDGRHGLLARGRGSDHQADALGELLIPTPFSLSIRLFVEAKFRADPIGISDLRNAQGVVTDVNEHFASDAPRDFPLRRHHYRYALFSVSGFTEDAQRYALAHQISLIDLQGPAFTDLRAVTRQTAQDLLRLAEDAGLSQFPLAQVRPVLRLALATGISDGRSLDPGFEAAYGRASQVPAGAGSNVLPADPLARIAATLSEELDDILILGFPQGPFVLVLQADDTNAFKRFLRDSPAEIEVDIRYAAGREKAGRMGDRSSRGPRRLGYSVRDSAAARLVAASGGRAGARAGRAGEGGAVFHDRHIPRWQPGCPAEIPQGDPSATGRRRPRRSDAASASCIVRARAEIRWTARGGR